MSYVCNGVWFSWLGFPKNTPIKNLPLPNDGAFDLDLEDNQGKFTGVHLITKAHVSGQCEREPHRVTFIRTEGITVYKYRGDIEEDTTVPGVLVARGSRQTLFLETDKVGIENEEEWIGVKTT